jgi:hypothetical protein
LYGKGDDADDDNDDDHDDDDACIGLTEIFMQHCLALFIYIWKKAG